MEACYLALVKSGAFFLPFITIILLITGMINYIHGGDCYG
nr:MAG TPA: hypothetical protein [Caudoviricetes sp.]